MKLKEIINQIDRSPKEFDYHDVEELCNQFDIYEWVEGNTKIKNYLFRKWLCTDSWVGSRAYFYEDELICVSHQPGRKSHEEFEWVSQEAFDKTYKYLKSLQQDNDEFPVPKIITEEELNTDVGEGFDVEFSEQILTKNVIYKETKEPVEIIDKFRKDYVSRKLEILFEDGSKKIVTTEDVLIPYNS